MSTDASEEPWTPRKGSPKRGPQEGTRIHCPGWLFALALSIHSVPHLEVVHITSPENRPAAALPQIFRAIMNLHTRSFQFLALPHLFRRPSTSLLRTEAHAM